PARLGEPDRQVWASGQPPLFMCSLQSRNEGGRHGLIGGCKKWPYRRTENQTKRTYPPESGHSRESNLPTLLTHSRHQLEVGSIAHQLKLFLDSSTPDEESRRIVDRSPEHGRVYYRWVLAKFKRPLQCSKVDSTTLRQLDEGREEPVMRPTSSQRVRTCW